MVSMPQSTLSMPQSAAFFSDPLRQGMRRVAAFKHGARSNCEYLPTLNSWQGVPSAAEMNPPGHSYPGPPLQHSAHVSELDYVLKARLANVKMTGSDLALVNECISELERETAKLGPEWRVKPFGGIENGFAMRGSDLDVTCYIEGMAASYTPLATQQLQTQLLPLLRTHPRFEVIDQIWTARVPILKLRFDQVLDVDLSCHNTEALPNTRLLKAYAELSPQVRELGLMVKLWAKEERVCGAPQGFLSSYALTLMAVYYLQVDQLVEMPVLPTLEFSGSSNGPSVTRRPPWECRLPTAVLLARFFRFYAIEFQWCTEVVSVRRGVRDHAEHRAYDQLRASQSPRLHIEDPFLTGRNLHCVLGAEQEWRFYLKICEAGQAIQTGTVPAALRWSGNQPLAALEGAAPGTGPGRREPPRAGGPEDSVERANEAVGPESERPPREQSVSATPEVWLGSESPAPEQ
eukprot:CAMPEP_0171064500 /NCGR_PEP_ID=MMETSP0766_2-20121228/6325_1 /TAXON_ID=439317 /ORGANISM="Gambierdiscus australes, Strain CAWD 149" /LENGTH=460 /DNA_ID=CAMNT_0011520539 /DNA_START=122 /DNA_END=1501 /DNA_ORIENTATION=+